MRFELSSDRGRLEDDRLQMYLDNAATTRIRSEVAEAMHAVQSEHFGNPSSPHAFGDQPRRLLDDAREFMRGAFSAARVALTSGGSEADLIGVAGAALARQPGIVLAGAADHPAVLAQRSLLTRLGYEFKVVPVDRFGTLTAATLSPFLSPDLRVISILHGHNELGTLAPLGELVPLIRRTAPDAHIHIDLVQSFGKLDFDLGREGVDSAAVSAHKFHGPRGVGCLAMSNTARITPLQPAGGQEGGLRGGTENVAGVVAMARAAELALTQLAEHDRHTRALADLLFERIQTVAPRATRLGNPAATLPHILSVRMTGFRAQTLQQILAAQGIAFSTGSACHSDDADGHNHVLHAIGLTDREASEVLRFSFAYDTTVSDIEQTAETLAAALRQLAKIAPADPREATRE